MLYYALLTDEEVVLHPIQKFRGISLFGRVKQKQKKRQQEAVLCHKNGHIVCHPRYTAFSTRSISFSNTRIECEADEFAECLMAYRYDLDEYYVRQFLAEDWRP